MIIVNGTPAGVGPCKAGDRLKGHIDGVGDLMITYAATKSNGTGIPPGPHIGEGKS